MHHEYRKRVRKMKKILLISTGGTFNKIYNPKNGTLDIDVNSKALEDISKKWLCEFEVINIISKDSLDIDNHDRLELLATISHSAYEHIIVIHGTDTMELSAKYIEETELEKYIVFTGAMVPYSIDPIEATANLALALGYIQNLEQHGVYIAMNGLAGKADQIKKNRTKGKFTL